MAIETRLTTFQFDDLDEGFQILLKLGFKYTDNIILQTTYVFLLNLDFMFCRKLLNLSRVILAALTFLCTHLQMDQRYINTHNGISILYFLGTY